MELSKNQIKMTKGIAILFMILLHLFCTKDYKGLYMPVIFIGQVPLVYYLALFGDCCVAIYCFCSGYGLFISYINNKEKYLKSNLVRIFNLYINFWIILFIFVVILGPIMGQANIRPGSFQSFLLNFTAINPSYNGAWWFLTTYIILVMLSSIINNIVINYDKTAIILISVIFYFISYIQRVKGVIVVNNDILDYLITQISLFGTSQFPFIIGIIFARYKIYSKLYRIVNKIKYRNILGYLLILIMIIVHGFVESLFVAVFTGIAFICIFNLIDKPKLINSLLKLLGDHSTNLWLTHMFFYSIYFRSLVFAPKYSFIIFIWLILMCIASSYVIKLIYKYIIRMIEVNIDNNKTNIRTT